MIARTLGRSQNRPIKLVTLSSAHLRAEMLSQGAALKSLTLLRPGKDPLALILDLGQAEAYVDNPMSAGAVIGRVAGRIRGGKFRMRGKAFETPKNDGEHTLHGGPGGFGWQNWSFVGETKSGGLKFAYSSRHEDQGFPGRVDVSATYSLVDDLTLRLDLRARTHHSAAVNMTHHPYWICYGTQAKFPSTKFQSVDNENIPTGGSTAHRWQETDLAEPLDHCFEMHGEGMREIANLQHDDEEFSMSIHADASHAQIYNGHAGHVCVEPQAPNDALNHLELKSIIVNPGKNWHRRVEYRFEI